MSTRIGYGPPTKVSGKKWAIVSRIFHHFPFPRPFSVGKCRRSRNAEQVSGDGLGGQVAKRFPIPSPQNVSAVVDRKFPSVERHAWRRSRGQGRKLSNEVLPWR